MHFFFNGGLEPFKFMHVCQCFFIPYQSSITQFFIITLFVTWFSVVKQNFIKTLDSPPLPTPPKKINDSIVLTLIQGLPNFEWLLLTMFIWNFMLQNLLANQRKITVKLHGVKTAHHFRKRKKLKYFYTDTLPSYIAN